MLQKNKLGFSKHRNIYLAVASRYLQKEFKSHVKAAEMREKPSICVKTSYCQCSIMYLHL